MVGVATNLAWATGAPLAAGGRRRTTCRWRHCYEPCAGGGNAARGRQQVGHGASLTRGDLHTDGSIAAGRGVSLTRSGSMIFVPVEASLRARRQCRHKPHTCSGMHARSPVCVVHRVCTHTYVATFTFTHAHVRHLPLSLLLVHQLRKVGDP